MEKASEIEKLYDEFAGQVKAVSSRPIGRVFPDEDMMGSLSYLRINEMEYIGAYSVCQTIAHLLAHRFVNELIDTLHKKNVTVTGDAWRIRNGECRLVALAWVFPVNHEISYVSLDYAFEDRRDSTIWLESIPLIQLRRRDTEYSLSSMHKTIVNHALQRFVKNMDIE
jgi:hypothetical protein